MNSNEEQERRHFENWARTLGFRNFDRELDGSYVHPKPRLMWRAWCAALTRFLS